MFEIEKDIPAPETRSVRISWPWKDMEIGDSVLISKELAGKAQIRCHIHGRQSGMKFKTKTLDDGRLRVWRIE